MNYDPNETASDSFSSEKTDIDTSTEKAAPSDTSTRHSSIYSESLAIAPDSHNTEAIEGHTDGHIEPEKTINDAAEEPTPAPMQVGLALRLPMPAKQQFVFPQFFAMRHASLVQGPGSVQARPLPLLLSLKAACGGVLPMFGRGSAIPVLLLAGDERDRRDDLRLIDQLARDEGREDPGSEAVGLSRLLIRHQVSNAAAHIDTVAGQESIAEGMPNGALLVIQDLANWISTPKLTADGVQMVVHWVSDLLSRGHTVIVFCCESVVSETFLNAFDETDLLQLEPDDVAPKVSGGGYTIHRPRRGLFDEAPLTFAFWYTVEGGRFAWGLEMRERDDGFTAKGVEVELRTRKINEYLRLGFPQKEIAIRLGISPSTVTRDKQKGRRHG